MIEQDQIRTKYKLAGYAALIEQYGLDVVPNWHTSLVATSGTRRIDYLGDTVREVYPPSYWPGSDLGDQLRFALKYDGTNLAILAALFEVTSEANLLDYIRSKPTGKYARRLWFLYEFLTGRTLPLDDLRSGNYIALLDPDAYFTVEPARPVRRQRINDNLPGEPRFCPTMRRTDTLRDAEMDRLYTRCREVVSRYPPQLLKRALSYLYTRETKSSFEIERINPTSSRTERFVALLQLAEQEDFCRKPRLVELQNRIVDPRFRDTDYRMTQNYVGQSVAWQREQIHFVAPKPDDLTSLMEGLMTAHGRMESGNVSPVIQAAAIAYGFVFLHPFEDGNGRIHRFLIHNILARRGFTPESVMFPISAFMLKNPADYDASLNAFSRNLMPLVEYTIDQDGRLAVENETATWYRYIDMTPQAEELFRFIEQTIDTELSEELSFLQNFDATKQSIQNIVDMPDRQIDLFIRLCIRNNGRLSARKRASHFGLLADEEIDAMERALQANYGKGSVADEK